MTPHNEAKKEDIANIVIMPGDPLRAKYIAEKFLENFKLVNSVRGMLTYTGEYKGKRITVMPSGMGIPTMGVYCYELYKFYDVDNIIRVGSCGSYSKDLDLFDIVLSENCYNEGNFALTLNNENCHIIPADEGLNKIIENTAKENNIKIFKGNTVCTECFDFYMTDLNKFLDRIPDGFNPLTAEMEAFSLFYTAKVLNKKASCLMSVVDSKFIERNVTTEERQTGLNTMIELALESCLNI